MANKLNQRLQTWIPDDPDFLNLEENFIRAIRADTVALDPGDTELIPLIAMVVQQSDTTLSAQIAATLAAGVTPVKLLEVVYQLEPVVGLPKVTLALRRIHAVFRDQDLTVTPAPATATSAEAGAAIQAQLYGTEIKDLMADLPAKANQCLPEWLTDHFFTQYYQRPSLTVAQRERYGLMALITLNVDFQINAHAKGSLKAGNSETILVWSALQLLPFIGFPLVINSVQKIHAAAAQLELA